jgi:hypothetical protein
MHPTTRRASPDNEPKKAWQNFGFCFLGVVLASMLGLPLVLLHAKVIQNQDLCVRARAPALGAAAPPLSSHSPLPLPPPPFSPNSGYWVASIFVALLGGGIAMCLKPARAQQR